MGILDALRNAFGAGGSSGSSGAKKAKEKDFRYTISREVLETAIAAARESHPHEFIALLGGNRRKKHISELVFLPSVTGGVSAVIHMDMLPIGMSVFGTIHSHPTPNPTPSLQDLETFSKRGILHVIIAYPYTMQSWRAYRSDGSLVELEVVEW